MKNCYCLLYILFVFSILRADASDKKQLFSDISKNSFEKQQICIHHDSFLRDSNPKKWHIGSNSDDLRKPMDYYSPRNDYESKDDGFYLEDGQLKNDKGVEVAESFRLIKVKLKNEFVIETSIVTTGKEQKIVFNYLSEKQYDVIRIKYTHQKAQIWLQSFYNDYSFEKKVLSFVIHDKNIRIQFVPSGFRLLNGDQVLREVTHKVDTSKAIGLSIDNRHEFEYNFINVFNIEKFQTFDDNYYLDSFVTSYPRSKVEANNYKYSYSLDSTVVRGSAASERFELHQETCTDYKNDRVERVLDLPVRSNLRKIIVSFDVFLPENFIPDDLYEIIFQIHEGLFGDKAIGRSPSFSLLTQKGYWIIRQLATDKNKGNSSKDYTYNSKNEIGKYNVRKWTHFDVYIKEGYEKDHNPLLLVFKDGQYVYSSLEPNCYNTPRGGYIRYGIYKAQWLSQREQVTERVLYIDNLQVKM